MPYSSSMSSTTLSLESIEEIACGRTSDVEPPTVGFVDRLTDETVSLPSIYTRPGHIDGLSPSMLAAAQPDSRILSKVLWSGHHIYCTNARQELFPSPTRSHELEGWSIELLSFEEEAKRAQSEFGPDAVRVVRDGDGITTPLMEAIRAQLPGNVEVLLGFNADPNGVPLELMEHYAAYFLRFRPAVPPFDDGAWDVASRYDFLDNMHLSQSSPLTREEIEDRFWDGMAPFWSEQDFTPANFYHHGESMPSLVEAARCGSIEIFDSLLQAGADKVFWVGSQKCVPSHRPPVSSLSVSSPIHAALQSNDMEMLKHLLKLGFNPNVLPLANPTRCFTPLMATIIQHETFNKTAFDILYACPATRPALRTPVFGVHLLHFAVASLDLDMLKHIVTKIPLLDAGKTNLGHSLLHVACMPPNARAVQRHSQAIYYSIHETRDLHAQNDPHASLPPPGSTFSTNKFEADFAPHTDVVTYLWKNGIQGVQDEDIHGNTPLHYLAGCCHVNWPLLTWFLEQDGVSKVWVESKNRYGYTAQELFRSGEYARIVLGEDRPKPWFERQWTRKRWVEKQAVWRSLLGDKAMRSI